MTINSDFLDRLKAQYQASPVILALIEQISDPLQDTVDVCEWILAHSSIDTADGEQLDFLGEMIGAPRPSLQEENLFTLVQPGEWDDKQNLTGFAVYKNLCLDGSCESSFTSEWLNSGATLTKQTTSPYVGVRNLRVAYDATTNPFAYQNVMTIGDVYRLTGVARGDATVNPSIRDSTVVLWTGTSSTSWQSFDVTFTATTGQIRFHLIGTSGYTEFDDIFLLNGDEIESGGYFSTAEGLVDQDNQDAQYSDADYRVIIRRKAASFRTKMTRENLYTYVLGYGSRVKIDDDTTNVVTMDPYDQDALNQFEKWHILNRGYNPAGTRVEFDITRNGEPL